MNIFLSDREMERRKQQIRDIWKYKIKDHIPVMLQIQSNPWGFSMHDELFSTEKQFMLRSASIDKTLALVPDDVIPVMFNNVGCVAIEQALGIPITYGNTDEDTPAVIQSLFSSLEEMDLAKIKSFDPWGGNLVTTFLERERYFFEQTEGKIPLTCLDMNGPMAIAMDMVGSSEFLMGMYTDPDKIHELLSYCNGCIEQVTDACIDVVQGIDHLACTDFTWEWFPEGHKGHVSDDVSAMISPALFQQFSIPTNSHIFQKYGPGTLHNCGPNPCCDFYLEHTPRIFGADLNYKYSKDDLHRFKQPFDHKGIIYLGISYSGFEQAIQDYKYIMNALSPNVIAIASFVIDEKYIDSGECDVARLYDRLRTLSEQYAAELLQH